MTDSRTVEPEHISAPPLADMPRTAIAAAAPEQLFKSSVRYDENGKPIRHFISIGERIHGLMTYAGADWLLNSAIGVSFTFWGARTQMGQKLFTQPAEWAFGKLFSPIIKNPEILKKSISGGKDFLGIMVGGTLVNPIITSMEKHENKRSITQFFDRIIYGNKKVDDDEKFQRAYAEIDKEPVKDTSGVWISRAIAIAPLWAASFNPGVMKFLSSNEVPLLKHINFNNISKLSEKTAETLNIKPGNWLNKTMLNPTTGESVSHWKALHGYIGFDYGMTIYYAILHAVSFNAVANIKHKNKVKKDAHESPATLASKPSTDVAPTASQINASSELELKPQAQVNSIMRDNMLVAAPTLAQSM